MKLAVDLKSLKQYMIVIMLSFAFLIMYLSYMRILHPEVIYMDSLRFLNYFDLSEQGKRPLILSWNQNEHRGLAPQILIYLNAKYFGLNAYRSSLLSGPVIAILGSAICLEYFRDRRLANNGASWITFTLFSAFCFFLLFSLANWEIYSLDLGVVLFGKNLAFVSYWVFIAHFLTREHFSGWKFVLLLIAGPAIILLIGFGWSYSFVATSIFCIFIYTKEKLGKSHFLLIASLVFGITIYIAGGYFVSSDRVSVFALGKEPSWGNAVISIFHAVFSAFVGVETSQSLGISNGFKVVSSFIFLCVVAWVVLDLILRRRKVPFLPAALIFYSSLHILSLAYARGRYDPAMSAAPRYYLDISLLVLGVVWALIFSLRNEPSGRLTRNIKIAMALFISLVFLAGQSFTSFDEWKKAPYRHDAFLHLKSLTLFGLASKSDAALFQNRFEVVEKGIDIQRRYGIGPYRDVACSSPVYGKGWFNADGGNNRWMGKEGIALVRNCGASLVIHAYLPADWPERNISIKVSDNVYAKRLIPGEDVTINIPTQNLNKYFYLHISVDKITIPADVKKGDKDERQLGAYIGLIMSEK